MAEQQIDIVSSALSGELRFAEATSLRWRQGIRKRRWRGKELRLAHPSLPVFGTTGAGQGVIEGGAKVDPAKTSEGGLAPRSIKKQHMTSDKYTQRRLDRYRDRLVILPLYISFV